MGVQLAIARRPGWVAVAVAVCAASGLACALLLQPERNPDRLWRSAQEDLNAGQFDRALAAMVRLLHLRPATEEHWMLLGQIEMARGRDAAALEHLERIRDGHRLAAQARSVEGAIQLRNQRARNAEDSLLRAVRLDPRDLAPRRKLVWLYCMQRRRRELKEELAALSRLTQLDFDQMLLWSSSLASSWDPSESAPIVDGFVKADPEDYRSRLTLAEALRRLRRIEEMKAVLAPLSSADPEVRAILARVAVAQGDDKEVERLTGDDADRHPVLARMRAMLDLSRRDVSSACKHLRAALALDPHNGAVLFQLGENLVRSGSPEEGRRHLALARAHDALYELIEQAETGRRDNVELLRAIADASLRLGLRAEARGWYLLAFQLDPASAETQRAIYRLEHDEAGQS
jgi:tetratricopeptide (TPR) repeat protein